MFFVSVNFAFALPSGDVRGDEKVFPAGLCQSGGNYVLLKNYLGQTLVIADCHNPPVYTWLSYFGSNFDLYVDKLFTYIEVASLPVYSPDDWLDTSEITLRNPGWKPPIITMPVGSFDDLVANTGTLFSDLWAMVVVGFGVPISFYIIPRIIALVPKK